jgi:uncharacterized protein (TIGR00251 family)
MDAIAATGSGIRIRIQVQPRGSRSEVVGLLGEALKVRVAAPPVDGAANEALVRFLAELLGVPRHAVRIASGGSSRRKVVEVEGVGVEEAARVLLGSA